VQSCGLIESNTQIRGFVAEPVSIDVSWWNPPKATKEAIGAKRHQLLGACLRFPMSVIICQFVATIKVAGHLTTSSTRCACH
jgi:hypothetical protein